LKLVRVPPAGSKKVHLTILTATHSYRSNQLGIFTFEVLPEPFSSSQQHH
jgi:hypothetical protein